MKSSFTQKFDVVWQAYSFANGLFRRTDVRYVRYKGFSEYFKMVQTIAYPILFAGVMQWFANKFSQERVLPFTYVMTAAAALILLVGLSGYFRNMMQEFAEMFIERVEYNLARRMTRKLARLKFPVLMDPKSVNIIENAQLKFYELENLALIRTRFVMLMITMCVGTGLSIFLNPLILLVCFCMTFTMDRVRSHFWKKVEDLRDSMVEEQRRSGNYRAHNSSLQNYIQYAAWGFVPYMNRNFTLIARKLMRARRGLFRAERFALLLWTPFVLAITIMIILWAIHDSFSKPQSLLILGVWFSAYKSTTDSFDRLFSFWRNARRDAKEFERYLEFQKLPERSTSLPRLSNNSSYTITLDSVTYTYPGRNEAAVENVSFAIGYGERVALIGRNGSGKTTTLSLLCGFLDPTIGTVQVNNENLQRVDIASWHEVMGCVTQTSDLCMTIGELVSGSKPTEISESYIWRALALVSLDEEIRKLTHGLNSRVGEAWSDGTDFSTGQRQKLRLAVVVYKVLMQKAKVIILDEPTANLDVESKVAVIQAFAELGITLIVSVHDQSLLPHFTRIIELDKGKLISDRIMVA